MPLMSSGPTLGPGPHLPSQEAKAGPPGGLVPTNLGLGSVPGRRAGFSGLVVSAPGQSSRPLRATIRGDGSHKVLSCEKRGQQ